MLRNIFIGFCLIFWGLIKAQAPKPQWQALLIVAHQEDLTQEAIAKMQRVETFLKSQNVKVHTFYYPNEDWKGICKVAPNCHILVYSGHGTPQENGYGGLALKESISPERIVAEMKLKPGALVCFQSVCGGAGSSASDDGDIGIKEAEKRVLSSSEPFFKIGAKAYYANNYEDGCLNFLKLIFQNQSFGDAYYQTTSVWTKVELEKTLPNSSHFISIAASLPSGNKSIRTSYDGNGNVIKREEIEAFKEYDIAFIGEKNFLISQWK